MIYYKIVQVSFFLEAAPVPHNKWVYSNMFML